MSSSTAAAGTTISQDPAPRSTPHTATPHAAVLHDARRTADLGRPRGRRSWADFAEVEPQQVSTR